MNRSRVYLRTALPILLALAGALIGQPAFAGDECGRTAGMQVYSNVYVHEETGDVLGYDLALKRNGDLGVDALLYVYEGGTATKACLYQGKSQKVT